MPVYRFEGPDGKTHRVEADSPEAAQAGLQEMWANREPDQVRGFMRGMMVPLGNAAKVASYLDPATYIPGLKDSASNPRSEAGQALRDKAFEYANGDMQNRPGGIGEFAGNIVGTIPAMAFGGPITQGLVGGAMLSEADNPKQFAIDTALGGVGGKLGDVVGNAVASGAKHVTDPAVQLLERAGVKMTPGQMLGGALKSWEDRAVSQPLVGGAIRKGREAADDTFNTAAINSALSEIGQTLPKGMKAGHDAVAFMGDAIGDAYDNLIPSLKGVRDPQMNAELSAIANVSRLLPADKAKQLGAILKGELFDRFSPTGEISGDMLKQAQKQLGYRASQFSRSGDANDQIIGEGLGMARDALMGTLERNSPASREALRAADTAFAKGVRVEKAASSVGAKEGRFTPQQLASAVKSSDRSARKKAVSRGEALMQDLSSAGQKVLQNSAANTSNTASHMAMMNPIAWAAGGAGLAGYQGAKALAAALKRVPPGAVPQLDLLRPALASLGVAGSAKLSGE